MASRQFLAELLHRTYTHKKGSMLLFDEKLIVFPEDSFAAKEDVIRCLTHLENSRVLDADRYEQAVL